MAERRYDVVLQELLAIVDAAPVGTALAPERELAARFGVARATVRRAIAQLVREGRLSSQQGRGTFVAVPPLAQPLRMTSFSEEMERRGLRPGGRVVRSQRRPADAGLATRLRIEPGTELLEIVRLRTADGAPLALETLWVAADLVPGMDPAELGTGSFYGLLADRFGLRVATGAETIGAAPVTGRDARLLGVPDGAPVLDFERTTKAADGTVVEHAWSRYRGDRYRIVADLELPAALWPGAVATGAGDRG